MITEEWKREVRDKEKKRQKEEKRKILKNKNMIG